MCSDTYSLLASCTTRINAYEYLKKQYKKDPSKKYYLSAAPQCPIPDVSIPLGAMQQADFVWTQFYNNPSCNLDSGKFAASFAAWSDQLRNSSRPGTPRLYIGASAIPAAGSGYVPGPQLKGHVDQARVLNVSNAGGMMLWGGHEAMSNVQQGTSRRL